MLQIDHPNYRLTEIFYSLQGEGFWTGTPVVFVRFSGCNLKCHFCDTDYSCKMELSGEQLLQEVQKYPAKRVVFTGGEPLLQLDEYLIRPFIRAGYKVHVETNGTIAPIAGITFLTVSPKQGSSWIVKRGDELKVVYEGQDLKQYEGLEFLHYYLQPCSETNTQEVIDICLKNPRWRLSLQTQKIVKIQ